MPFINNPDLETLKPDWQGNPIDKNGRFKNHIQPMDMGWRDVWKWQSGPRPDKKIKNAKLQHVGGTNPGSTICTEVLKGIVVVGVDSRNNENSFCRLPSGIYVDSGTLTYYSKQ